MGVGEDNRTMYERHDADTIDESEVGGGRHMVGCGVWGVASRV